MISGLFVESRIIQGQFGLGSHLASDLKATNSRGIDKQLDGRDKQRA